MTVVTDKNTANTPNSAGVNNLDNTGVATTVSTCAMAVPKVKVATLLKAPLRVSRDLSLVMYIKNSYFRIVL
jgi:hypothetical protein